ncbi:FMRFamide receptor [Plakobranchus ocellatus]|uniref:FMRFamide receptor n=1 Tax=Plakobranchus ocellatus TaxID=259542 RepID=A0AAV4BMG7_9GAST|nr:FMRFamide receptor [Plakobranchus ocellatus]
MATNLVPSNATSPAGSDLSLKSLNDSKAVSSREDESQIQNSCYVVHHIPGIVSNATSRGLTEFAINYGSMHGYIAIAVCCFGILSNSANIIVLTRKNMASSTNTLLLWLAVSDLLTMLSYLPFAIHFYIMEPADPMRMPFSSPDFAWIIFLLFHANFSIVCHSIAIWLTIALAIFRYIYICQPTSGAYYCSQRRAKFVVVLITFLTILVCIPNCGINYYGYMPGKSAGNSTGVGVSKNSSSLTINATTKAPPASKGYYYPQIRSFSSADIVLVDVNNWLNAILVKLVPCFMLTILTLLLVHAMHKAYRKRLKLKSQGRKVESDRHNEHNRTTRMLLAIVILFTLTELPQGILTLMNIFVDCFTEVVYYKLGDLLDIMALINNSINFVLYCIMSTQFRNTFWEIFCPARHRVRRPKGLRLRAMNSSGPGKSLIESSGENGSQKRSGTLSSSTAVTNGTVLAETLDQQVTLAPKLEMNQEENQDQSAEPLETEFPVGSDIEHHDESMNSTSAKHDDTEGQGDCDKQPLAPERV